jgi:hypothetical protein
MRTTVTLEPDLAARLQQLAREREVSFKAVLNDAVRAGLEGGSPPSRAFRVRARPLGVRADVDLAKALSLAAEMEDAEILRKLDLRK